MSASAAAVTAANTLNTKSQLGIAATKAALDSQKQVTKLVDQAIQSGEQALNSSGRGQIVNILT